MVLRRFDFEAVDDLEIECHAGYPRLLRCLGERADAVLPAALAWQVVILAMLGEYDASKLRAAKVAGDSHCVGENLLAAFHRGLVLAGNISVGGQPHGDDHFQAEVGQTACQPCHIKLFRIQAGKFDKIVAEVVRLLYRRLEIFLRRTSGPDESVNSELQHHGFLVPRRARRLLYWLALSYARYRTTSARLICGIRQQISAQAYPPSIRISIAGA